MAKKQASQKIEENEKTEIIKTGDKVSVEYTGMFDDGKIFDTNIHGDHAHPLEFTVGNKMVIQGFDNAVIGMKQGDEKTFKIPANEAYGEKNSQLIQTIPKPANFPAQTKEGMIIGIGPSQDRQMPALIVKITDTEVTLDLNHPLAGKNLTFKIKIISIN